MIDRLFLGIAVLTASPRIVMTVPTSRVPFTAPLPQTLLSKLSGDVAPAIIIAASVSDLSYDHGPMKHEGFDGGIDTVTDQFVFHKGSSVWIEEPREKILIGFDWPVREYLFHVVP